MRVWAPLIVSVAPCIVLVALMLGCGGTDTDNHGTSTTPDTKITVGGLGFSRSNGEQIKSPSEQIGGQGRTYGTHPGPSQPSKKEVEAFAPVVGGDNSVQTFGTPVEGGPAREVALAMRSFLRSVAVANYVSICSGLTGEAVEQAKMLASSAGLRASCPLSLKHVMAPRRSVEREILRAANGVIYEVRVEGDTAFVLFTPKGGAASYFVMKRESGSWQATGVSPGAPISSE
jgi:hypothetical protein